MDRVGVVNLLPVRAEARPRIVCTTFEVGAGVADRAVGCGRRSRGSDRDRPVHIHALDGILAYADLAIRRHRHLVGQDSIVAVDNDHPSTWLKVERGSGHAQRCGTGEVRPRARLDLVRIESEVLPQNGTEHRDPGILIQADRRKRVARRAADVQRGVRQHFVDADIATCWWRITYRVPRAEGPWSVPCGERGPCTTLPSLEVGAVVADGSIVGTGRGPDPDRTVDVDLLCRCDGA